MQSTSPTGLHIYFCSACIELHIEHLIIKLRDRVLSLLDRPGMKAVIDASVDWANAFSRTDRTKTITKLINMGLRSPIVSIVIEILEDRQMTVK